uniref:Tubulin epsilon and delta complex protein 1 domain-containing protein n=1 Tax=Ixodes ricinus TaxID=34613 RepID=V5H6S3_IXORI
MSGSGTLESLFELAATCGLTRASSDTKFESQSPEPCDDCLRELVNQSARLVISKCRKGFSEFKPSSNYEALLALCWLVAKFSLPELLLKEAVASLDVPKQKRCKEETRWRAEGADALGSIADECKQIASMSGRLRASMKGLSASTQQLASLVHQVHQKTAGISLSEDMNHLTLSQISHLAAAPGGSQKFQAELQRALQAVTHYTDWKKGEPVFWTWIESPTPRVPRLEELENFKTQVEEMCSEIDFGVVAMQPKLVLEPSSNSNLAQINAEMRPKLAVIEKELGLKRDRLRESLTNLGLQYEAATFMP